MGVREAHQVSELPQEMGQLGRLIDAWAGRQRFRPTQRAMARELRVSPQLLSNWVRGNYKTSLKPRDVEALVRMMAPVPADRARCRQEVLEAMLRDVGLWPEGGFDAGA